MKRCIVAVAAMVALVICIGVALALWLNPIAGGPADQYVFPIRWTPALDPDSTIPADSEIEILENGAAQLTDVATGATEANGDGRSCLSATDILFSGPGQWTAKADGTLRIETSDGTVVLLAEPARFGGVDWESLHQEVCGTDDRVYGVRTAAQP